MTDSGPAPALRRVINAAGTMTALGASAVSAEVAAAAAAVLPRFVLMAELQQAASRAIAEATGAEAGFVTASSAAAIAVAVAACMTGTDPALIERLPDTEGLRRQVVIQQGHDCNFGAEVGQMIRLSGARPVRIGAATSCGLYHLERALTPATACAVYVVSHQTVQGGLIGLRDFCRTCRAAGVPVIVDAASEYDLKGFVTAGADLVLYSAHKVLGGLTAGIVAGRADLVHACYMQEIGIGRAMKVGKEGVAGVIAALARWRARDAAAIRAAEDRRIEQARRRLAGVPGLAVEPEPDPTGNPITRLTVRVDPSAAGLTAADLADRLMAGDPAVAVRDEFVDRGRFQLDPCNLSDDEMATACDRLAGIVAEAAGGPAGAPAPPLADGAVRARLAWIDGARRSGSAPAGWD